MFYRNQKFTSPASIYARIKEEMKSYFSTGQIDDLMFPIWTKDCIKKFKNTHLQIKPCVLDLMDYKAELPCDFKAVREVYICTTFHKGPIKNPFTYYYQTDCRVGPVETDACTDCDKPECTPSFESPVPFLGSTPEQFRVTHKVNTWMDFTFSLQGLLKPGNHKTIRVCHDKCPNLTCESKDTFDIINNNIVTSFPTGTIYISYYADTEMDNGYTEIPDEHEFAQYVYKYIRYMVYQQLYEQSNDDQASKLERLMVKAEKESDEQFIIARNDAMSETVYDVQAAIKRSYNRNNRFRLK